MKRVNIDQWNIRIFSHMDKVYAEVKAEVWEDDLLSEHRVNLKLNVGVDASLLKTEEAARIAVEAYEQSLMV